METSANRGLHGWVVVAALLYLLFVVYGSLVPFAFVDRPMAEVVGAFLPPRWLPLAATDRADWVANAFLYMPLAFLALEACCGGDLQRSRRGDAVVVVGSLVLLAVAVEFVQGFFPPRTVSGNDLAAEVAGILIGAGAWLVAGAPFRAIVAGLRGNPRIARQALALAVAASYLVLALFPFDFVVSRAELAARMQGPAAGLFLASSACTGTLACGGRLALEVVGGIAFGAALHWLRARPAGRSVLHALLQGSVWGIAIELLQLLEVSGVAQGASVVVRAAGIATGLRVSAFAPHAVERIRKWSGLRTAIRVAWLAYALALLWGTGLARGYVASLDDAWARLAEIRFIPFYYHYYVSEQWALVSVAVHAALFAPAGALAALGRLVSPPSAPHTARAAILIALALAFLFEAGKLFAGRRPDPTDLILAAAASYVAYRLVMHYVVGTVTPHAVRKPGDAVVRAAGLPLVFGPLTVIGSILLLFVTLALLRYPLPATALVVFLALYAVALLRWPGAWLLVLPALLPVLDLAPWTGWLFVDEFDLFAMVTIAAVSIVPMRAAPACLPRHLRILVIIAGGFALLALVRGLLPPEPVTTDALWGLQHRINALRPARAVLWALLLLALVRQWSDGPDRDLLRFARGVTLGLLGAGLVTAWERATFAGIADFSWAYRAVGAFSAASTGGAQLESFVAAALPFAACLLVRDRPRWRAVALVALALGIYAVAATISRTALLAAGAGLVTFALGALAARRSASTAPQPRVGSFAVAAVAVLLLGSALAMIVSGRMANVGSDFAERAQHWRLVAAMSGGSPTGAAIGEGLGTFPEAYFWNGPSAHRPALYSFRSEKGGSYVRVAPGASTFLDQFVAATPSRAYTLRARVRSAAPGAVVTLALCEKWILYSTDCRQTTLATTKSGDWEEREVAIAAPASRSSSGLSLTTRLSISGGSVQAPIDVTGLALVDGDGRNVLTNGDFAAAGTRWLVSADDPWPWNVSNAFVETLFEQGWTGLLLLAWWIAYAVVVLAARARDGNLLAAAAAGGLVGFLVPACFDSVIDDPRMRLLLWLLLTVPLLASRVVQRSPGPLREDPASSPGSRLRG